MTPEDTENNVQALVYFPKDNVSELEDIKYVINEFRALFKGCDISSIARQLRNANNHLDKLSILIKIMPIFSKANTVFNWIHIEVSHTEIEKSTCGKLVRDPNFWFILESMNKMLHLFFLSGLLLLKLCVLCMI
ncbi:hypothetical protein HNY73_010690 [Argiope bruennichi]|uniref:Uncharacterized protein n=1 Tax=Argiope bruennichi TaxID=94029 RepID=A0A8T0F7X9_ARGBR|nr:hypothetical protein HNY73_010690 [Argiope bruennichi]